MLPDPDETALVLEQRQRAEAAASTAASAVGQPADRPDARGRDTYLRFILQRKLRSQMPKLRSKSGSKLLGGPGLNAAKGCELPA